MTTYSHSRISTFEQCPYKFKLQYIDKVKVDVPTTIECFMGDLVHQALEKLYADLKFQKLSSKEDLLKFFNELWGKEWTDDILIVKEDLSADNYRKMGEKYISDYYDHYKPFDEITVIGLETQDRMALPDGNSYHIRIDKLGFKDNVYYVCDYKTNSRMKDQEEADSDRQLAMYSIWVKDKFKDAKKVVLLWHMLAFDKEVSSERSGGELLRLQQEVVDSIKKIESATEYPTNVSALCSYCVYKQICPSFKHEVELSDKSVKEFKEDDGVKLVDRYVELDAAEKELSVKKEAVRRDLIEFSKQKDIDVVSGSNKLAKIKSYQSITLPKKSERGEINALIKEKGYWDKYSDVDVNKLKKAILSGKLPVEIKVIEKYAEIKEAYRVIFSKKGDKDE